MRRDCRSQPPRPRTSARGRVAATPARPGGWRRAARRIREPSPASLHSYMPPTAPVTYPAAAGRSIKPSLTMRCTIFQSQLRTSSSLVTRSAQSWRHSRGRHRARRSRSPGSPTRSTSSRAAAAEPPVPKTAASAAFTPRRRCMASLPRKFAGRRSSSKSALAAPFARVPSRLRSLSSSASSSPPRPRVAARDRVGERLPRILGHRRSVRGRWRPSWCTDTRDRPPSDPTDSLWRHLRTSSRASPTSAASSSART